MHSLMEIMVSNALVASVLALAAALTGHLCRRPALVHILWVLVLLKLVTPSFLAVPIPWPAPEPLAAEVRVSEAADGQVGRTPAKPAVQEPVRQVRPSPPGAAILAPEERFFRDRLEASAAKSDSVAQPVDPANERRAEVPLGTAPVQAAEQTSLPGVMVALWLAGSFAWLLWTMLPIYRFQRLLRFASRATEEVQQQVERLAQRMSLRRCPAVWLVPGTVSPMVWAVCTRPRLLFPARLLERLDNEQRAALLVHELAHVRRRDHWVRLLELVVTCLYWWHPIVWWARREIHEAEEQCCDAWVVWALAGARRAYALALLETVAFFSHARSTLPAPASGIGQVTHLRRRLKMILQEKTPRSLSWAGCLAVGALGLFLLPILPTQAQQRPGPAGAQDQTEQEIQALKQAIRLLEKQRDAQKAMAVVGNKQESPELKKAREEFKIAQHRVDLKCADLDVAKKQLAAASERLRKAAAAQGLSMIEVLGPSQSRGQKMSELEKKLAQLMTEVKGLRGQLMREAEARNALPDPGNLEALREQVGKTFTFRVTGALDGSVWGNDVYTTDSSLATAAVHAGVVKPGQTGIVRVKIVKPPASFGGRTQHGVSSATWGAWPGAFQFVIRPEFKDVEFQIELKAVHVQPLDGKIQLRDNLAKPVEVQLFKRAEVSPKISVERFQPFHVELDKFHEVHLDTFRPVEVQLPGPSVSVGASHDRRLDELEKRVDQLMKAVERLRTELRRRPAK